MSNVHTFVPRWPAPTPPVQLPPSPAEVRRQIEEAAQAALDTADRLIAILDSMDGGHRDGMSHDAVGNHFALSISSHSAECHS
jgi:nucleoside 2-deoxyribosyltransferase